MAWTTAINKTELEANSKACIEIDNKKLLILFHQGEIYAIENQCSHAFRPLDEGTLLNGIIQCPFHGARFCIKTGEHLSPPAFKGIKTYPTRLNNYQIEVDL